MKFSIFILTLLFYALALKAEGGKIHCNIASYDYPFNTEYAWPSSEQALSLSKCFYQSANYGISKLWPINSVGYEIMKNLPPFVFNVFTAKMPLSEIWLHEHGHRIGAFMMGAEAEVIMKPFDYSYMPRAKGSWSSDKSKFKEIYNTKRAFLSHSISAATELGVELAVDMQKDQFFYQTHLPNISIYFLSLGHLITYLMLDAASASEPETEEHAMDFGHWLYVLKRIKVDEEQATMLTSEKFTPKWSKEEIDYLNTQFTLSFLNLFNPMLLDFNSFETNGIRWNAFLNYFATPFGNDVVTNFLFQRGDLQSHLTLHILNNEKKTFMGMGIEVIRYPLITNLTMNGKLQIGQQPKNLLHQDEESRTTALAGIGLLYGQDFWEFKTNITYKTKGWIIRNPYLEENISLYSGLGFVF